MALPLFFLEIAIMKKYFSVLVLVLFSVTLMGCGKGRPSDVKPVTATGNSPVIDKIERGTNNKKAPGAQGRGEGAMEDKIKRGSRGGRGAK